jgi:hypothetical protein
MLDFISLTRNGSLRSVIFCGLSVFFWFDCSLLGTDEGMEENVMCVAR